MTNKESAFREISELVERFQDQYESYKKPDYNETQTRRDFIDPFFKALGWDIDNKEGYAEAYREVIHEDRVKVGGATKAPDYSFRLVGGKRLFFVEAKRPGICIKEDIHSAYQVRRYGWSAKLPISIITNFEEFTIYDCTKKPIPTDKASVARIKYMTFKDYLVEFDFIWDTFSKERILKGGFDKFIQTDTNKKGTTTVDKEFLQSLDKWRTYLATSISLRNKHLNEDEINFAVQQAIDRIIFLRIAEDRGVEVYDNLKYAIKQGDYYKNLFEIYQKADEKYNSGLFDFKKDQVSKDLVIDNKVIKSIVNELYYPECPYEFSVLSVEILGYAYEQFLGKVIRITKAHQAKIEEKPEVRKAGGVYYTPQYIVEYIVKNTVGKLIEGKTPKDISKIKIVDPACGSGSFLIGAFQYLLDYHKNYYTNNSKPSKGKKDNPLTPDGNLTTSEKKRILLNNIYGVDIDVNAVEVTKLSLLLKCMEGETQASIGYQLTMFNERALPTLDDNIKCGNSLIHTDVYENQLDFGEDKKIKAFDWEKAFPDVFNRTKPKENLDFKDHFKKVVELEDQTNKLIQQYITKEPDEEYRNLSGGFDIVIGNPPYVRIQSLKETSKESLEYYNKTYQSAHYGNYDLYVLFVEKGKQLLIDNGLLGFILPNKFFNTDYGIGLRKLLTEKKLLKEIIDFEHHQVFENATTYCCLLFLQNRLNISFSYSKAIPEISEINILSKCTINSNKIDSDAWNFYNEEDKSILKKLENKTIQLIHLPCEISRGSSTGNDKIFVFELNKENKLINGYGEEVIIEEDILKIPVFATDFNRFNFKSKSKFRILFPYNIDNGNAKLIDDHILKSKYPNAYRYLVSKKSELAKRKQFANWYGYSAARNLALHSQADILIPLLANKGLYTTLPDNKSKYTLMAGGGFSISIRNDNYNKKYILGLLNSNLLFWYLSNSVMFLEVVGLPVQNNTFSNCQ